MRRRLGLCGSAQHTRLIHFWHAFFCQVSKMHCVRTTASGARVGRSSLGRRDAVSTCSAVDAPTHCSTPLARHCTEMTTLASVHIHHILLSRKGTYSGNDTLPQSSRQRMNTGASKSGPGTTQAQRESVSMAQGKEARVVVGGVRLTHVVAVAVGRLVCL